MSLVSLLIGRECGRKVWCAREASATVCGLEGVWEEGTGVARCKNVVARACRQHTSAYVCIRQHTSKKKARGFSSERYVSIRQGVWERGAESCGLVVGRGSRSDRGGAGGAWMLSNAGFVLKNFFF